MEKVLLISGGSSDIGKRYLLKYRLEYDYIFIHYNQHFDIEKELNDILCEGRYCAIQADLTDEKQLERMIEKIAESGKKVTHFIHLPSLPAENKKFHKMGWDIFEKNLNVSIRSAVTILQKIIPDMVKIKYGRIVIMLSYTIVNQPVTKYMSAYVMTKYALLGLIKSLSVEYSSKNITINGISPSMINTKFIHNMPDVIIQKRIEESPLKRNLEVDDILPTLHFLLSESANCISGENVQISAGN